tara:strand:+ start:441 stop:641 length:201 start_codon:yes stop_codon:yes gene_type:complete
MKIKIHDIQTGKVIERNLTDDELAQWEADQLENSSSQAEAESKATARAALLEKLGITSEEAALLLS